MKKLDRKSSPLGLTEITDMQSDLFGDSWGPNHEAHMRTDHQKFVKQTNYI